MTGPRGLVTSVIYLFDWNLLVDDEEYSKLTQCWKDFDFWFVYLHSFVRSYIHSFFLSFFFLFVINVFIYYLILLFIFISSVHSDKLLISPFLFQNHFFLPFSQFSIFMFFQLFFLPSSFHFLSNPSLPPYIHCFIQLLVLSFVSSLCHCFLPSFHLLLY